MEALEDRRLLAGAFSVVPNMAGNEPTQPGAPTFATFTVNLNVVSGSPSPGSVNWSAVSAGGDTATAGVDFTPVSGTANFPSGAGVTTVQVPVLWDGVAEWTETFRVVLSGATGDNTIGVDTAGGQIFDSPLPVVTVSVVPSVIDEGASSEFVFQRWPANGSLTVYYMFHEAGTASPGDYSTVLCGGSITFAPGQMEIRAGVSAIDDTLLENMETLLVNLLPPPGSGPPQYTFSSGSTVLQIHDGEHGIVETLFATEWDDEDVWRNIPDNETIWDEASNRWLPDVPAEVVEDVHTVWWFKRPHDNPQVPWTQFATGTLAEPAEGHPGAGLWDIMHRAYYGARSWYESHAKTLTGNGALTTVWAKGYDDQQFRENGLNIAIFPERLGPIDSHIDQFTVKVVVTLQAAVPAGKVAVRRLSVFDPDHAHNPEVPTNLPAGQTFDPNDEFDIPDPALPPVLIRKAKDNRQSAGGFTFGGLGITPATTTLTFAENEQTKEIVFTIVDRQPGNNFLAATAPVLPGETQNMVDRIKFAENGVDLVYTWKGADLEIPWRWRTLHTLTVWRTLWVELDSMRAPAAGDGPFDQALADPDYDKGPGNPGNPAIDLLAPQFLPANIEVRKVVEGTSSPAHDIKDELVFYHYVADAPPTPMGPDGPSTAAGLVRDVPSAADLWVIQLIGAYEWHVDLDFDPDEELWTLGNAHQGATAAFVYYEAIRDRAAFAGSPTTPQTVSEAKLLLRTPLHESGHLMGAAHGTNPIDGIMNINIGHYDNNDANAVFTEKHYAIFQAKPQPGTVPAP